jgi:hypothetical protein
MELAPQRLPQITDTETTVQVPLPPVIVKLSDLKVTGKGAESPYIIKSDEAFDLTVDIDWSGGTLVDLILYIGVDVEVTFAIEGFGTAAEVNLPAAPITTECRKRQYTAKYAGMSPEAAGLTPGFYKMAALLTVKSPECSGLGPVAFGYISDVVFQVYA